ncbi:MAG: MotA/TolQ/ExbB proton channel family protein [Chthoniobacterales bacterium]|nr:MotA/TolQ/ExbB proton channel family protein [Chthoniobacterales bacterium]
MTQALHAAFEFFARGGLFMALLLVLSIAALAVILFRAAALRVNLIFPRDLETAVEALQPGESLENLVFLAKSSPTPLGRILSVCLEHLRWPRQENVEAVQMRARHEIVRMESGLVLLEVATGIAPLLGLLGTLSGLVGIFSNIGEGGDPAAVARGISEALNTTIVGLAVAVVCLVAYNYFQRKVETMAVSLEGAAADLMAKCYGAEG